MKLSTKPIVQDHNHGGTVITLAPERDHGTVARINSFVVTTDSVVATATVVITDATRRIEIDWGDGATDVLRHRPGVGDNPAPGTNPLPRGTYEVEHVFDASADGRPFERIVFVRTDDSDGSVDFRQRRVIVTPRYRIVHYPMSVRLGEACDPFWVSGVRIRVVQSIDGDVVNVWNWDASNSFFSPSQRYLLQGSGASVEVELAPVGQAQDTKLLVFDFTEKDTLTPDDRNRIIIHLRFDNAALENDLSERIERTDSRGCEIIYSYGREISLLKPRKQSSAGVFSPG